MSDSTDPKADPKPAQPLPTSPSQIADQFVNGLVEENTNNLMGGGYSFSLHTLIKLLVLLSIGEIKDVMRLLLSGIGPLLKRSPAYALMAYLQMSGLMSRMMWRRTKQPLIMPTPVNHRLTINVSDHFMLALYCYIMDNGICQFDRYTCQANVDNLKDRSTTEMISGIRVGKVTILDHIDYEINMQTKEPMNMSITEAQCGAGPGIKSYVELFSEKQQKCLLQNIKSIKRNNPPSDLIKKLNAKPSYFCELDIAKMIVERYPGLDLDDTCFDLLVLFNMYGRHKSTDSAVRDVVDRMKLGKKCFFDPSHVYVGEFAGKSPTTVSYTISFNDLHSSRSELAKRFGGLFDCHALKKALNTKPKDAKKQITIEIPHTEPASNVDPILNEFINSVCQYQRKDVGIIVTIKIFCLLIETEITHSTKPNPEYEQWEEQKRVMDEYKDLSAKDFYKAPKVDISKIKVPPKTIAVETKNRVITNKLLNETKKSLDTLYLRKADMTKLLTSLDQFRNKKEVLATLGLPNKLNILFYGEPGTGKSTAIQTVATYLGRNIYYLDLKDAVTNQDLQMMFEYVNKNVQNGGIIVIEDIDAMTDVVMKRESKAEARVNQLASSGDSKLSLEYLLNILQGTLTLDDSIFIVTTNHIDHLDPAFYRDGRFDVKIELKLADHYQIQSVYQKFLNRKIPEALLARIPEGVFSPATVIFHIKDYLFDVEATDEAILSRFME